MIASRNQEGSLFLLSRDEYIALGATLGMCREETGPYTQPIWRVLLSINEDKIRRLYRLARSGQTDLWVGGLP